MKLTCDRERLSKALKAASRIASGRATLPILSNVLLATSQGRLKVVTTDLETAITMWIDAEAEEQAQAPARMLGRYVCSLRGDTVSIENEGQSLTVTCGKSHAVMRTDKAKEYPSIPTVEGVLATVESDALRAAIERVAFAASLDEGRPVLTGVNMTFDGNSVELVSADGFRLAIHTLELKTPVAERTVILVPAKAMTELGRLLADQQEPVEIAVDNARVLFRLKDAEIVSQLVQGMFPPYENLIPQSYTTRAVVDVNDFLRVARSASDFCDRGILRIYLTEGKLSFRANAEDVGHCTDEIDAAVEGDDNRIAFNVKYLIDVLSALHDGAVALEVRRDTEPGLFRFSDNYKYLVMPPFMQW